MVCSNCKHNIENDAQFCSNCGSKVLVQDSSSKTYVSKYNLDFREALTLSSQIRTLFFKDLESVVETEIGPNQYRQYFDQFYKSDFYKDFDIRTKQLAEEAYSIHSGPSQRVGQEVDQLLGHNFQGFIEHFMILHCNGLQKIKMPEAILKYTNAKIETVNLRQMVLDYLDFNNEQDKVYTDIFSLPPMKVKNAIKSFLFTQSQEKIFFICDQTIFGSCREGFAMTEQALHWKSHFNPPHSVFYEELAEIKKEAEWISINGLFFNANKSINYKMMKLLKKIKSMHNI